MKHPAVLFTVLISAVPILPVVAQAPAPAPMPQLVDPALASAIPDQHGIRRMAVLRGIDKITGRPTDIFVPAGQPVRYGSLTITLRYCHTVPPEEPPETSAFLQIDDMPPDGSAPVRMFSGWMFASTPGLNGLEHPVYDVWVITCRTDEPPPPPPDTAPTDGEVPAADAPAARSSP